MLIDFQTLFFAAADAQTYDGLVRFVLEIVAVVAHGEAPFSFRPAPRGLRMGRLRVELRPRKRPGTHSPREFAQQQIPQSLLPFAAIRTPCEKNEFAQENETAQKNEPPSEK